MTINRIFSSLLLIALSCTPHVLSSETVTQDQMTDDTSAHFAGELFTIISDTNKDNVVLSPFGIRNAMGIAGLGAGGETLEEITKAMQLESLEKEFPEIAGIYAPDKINSGEMENDVSIQLPVKQDLQMFVKKGVKIDDDFLAVAKNIMETDCEEFGTSQELLSGFPAVDLDDAKLAILNTIKFSGRWGNPFSSVCSLPFHLGQDREIQAVFMVNDEPFFAVADFGDYYGFSLGFMKAESSHPDFGMIFIVPKEIDGVGGIMQDISEGCLPEWIEKICSAENRRSNKLYLPRFTIDTAFELKEYLSLMGIKSAFDETADFSKMSPGTPLRITNFLHNAKIDVDEYGVEASAETAVFYGSIGLRRPQTILLDRPFVYLIHDQSNRQVLFIGRCDNPVNPGTLVPSDDQQKLSECL